MLGFFIKSKQAKIYRKKVAEFLRLCDEARQKKFNEARATITEQISEISNLKAMQISRNNQINDYKSQISQKNDEILSLKQQILREKKNEKAVILLGRANEKISEAYIEIQRIMAHLCGDEFLKINFKKEKR